MRLLLYARENPKQIFQKPLETEWVRVRRRAAQEIAHLLLTERLLSPATRAKLCLTHEWLDSELDTPERALEAVQVEACTEEGEALGGQRFNATDLAMDFARRTIQGMLRAEQVKQDDNVVFFVAGVSPIGSSFSPEMFAACANLTFSIAFLMVNFALRISIISPSMV